MRRLRTAIALLACTLVERAVAGVPAVIFSNLQNSPTSNVPGLPGHRFYDGAVPQVGPTFSQPFGSPDGNRWALRTLILPPSPGYIAILSGIADDGGANAAVMSRTPTFFDSGINFSDFSFELGIDDAGNFAFAADTTAPSGSDEIVARWTAADGFALLAREGQQAVGHPPGVAFGSSANTVHTHDDGAVSFRSLLTGGGGIAIFRLTAAGAGLTLVQTGATVPENQVAGTHLLIDLYQYLADASGENDLYQGTVAGGGGNVIAVNNVVVAQNNLPLPGAYPGFFNNPNELLRGASLSPHNGHYAFRCPADFIVENGHVVVVDDAVVAASGEPIVPGSPEFWYNSGGFRPFMLNVVNSHGDYVIGGGTNGLSGVGGALVFNRQTVLLHAGDLVDLDGDGIADVGFRCGIRTDSALLTVDGRLYFSVPLENANGDIIGEAFMWLPVPVRGEMNCDGTIDFFDIDPFLLALFDESAYAAAYPDCWHITADINRDGNVDFFDIDPFVECLFAECP